ERHVHVSEDPGQIAVGHRANLLELVCPNADPGRPTAEVEHSVRTSRGWCDRRHGGEALRTVGPWRVPGGREYRIRVPLGEGVERSEHEILTLAERALPAREDHEPVSLSAGMGARIKDLVIDALQHDRHVSYASA